MSNNAGTVPSRLHLFQGYGVELEYMIVDKDEFHVRPISDRILVDGEGKIVNELNRGFLSWSNELVLHVLELKTTVPVPELTGLDTAFSHDILRINRELKEMGARLMPAAAHPFMDPLHETRLWSHDSSEIYGTFDRIFGCRGHGWANLQSVHLNLPFDGDNEFRRLHEAIRLLLPMIPAIAASSPYLDSRVTGYLDSRLEMYRKNCARVFSVTGHTIPEPVRDRREYRHTILKSIYDDLSPYDPEGILRYEWVNARGAIARFERNTIEIRVIDVQECPKADIALIALIVAAVKRFAEDPVILEHGSSLDAERLSLVLLDTIRSGENASISDTEYLFCLGFSEKRLSAREIWHGLLDRAGGIPEDYRQVLETILKNGTLATRMKKITGLCTKQNLKETCRALCECLAGNSLLIP